MLDISYINISCQVPVYYLNADFDYWNILDWNRPDIDCLHTVNLPMKTTIMMIFVHTVNLPTKTRKADNDKDAGGTSLAYASADDHLPLVVTDMSGRYCYPNQMGNIKSKLVEKSCVSVTTICLRTLHFTFLFPKSSYAFAFFFGSLLPVCLFWLVVYLFVFMLVCLFVCLFI